MNYKLFFFISATKNSSKWIIFFAKFIADYLISIVPISMIFLWICNQKSKNYIKLIIKATIALLISLLICRIIGYFFPSDRPFIKYSGYNFLHHSSNYSFPSDHGTVIFTFALSFLFWHQLWSGLSLLVVAIAISWSRIYLGAHWPIDILASFFISLFTCLSLQILWNKFLKSSS